MVEPNWADKLENKLVKFLERLKAKVGILQERLPKKEEEKMTDKNKEWNEGTCECGHHSKNHSYSLAPKSEDLECDKCSCQNYKFKDFSIKEGAKE